MSYITRQILGQISEIIRPFAVTAVERQALLIRTFGTDYRADQLAGSIDLNGTTSNFTSLLVRHLVDYGDFEPGKPALRLLLLTVRDDLGTDKQAEIDALLKRLYDRGGAPTLPDPYDYAPPSADHIFISYSRSDKDTVIRFITDIEKRGVHAWIDQSGLTPGTLDWEQALRDAIRGSRAIILAASPDSRRSTYVKDEIRIAQMYKRPIYPVWVKGDEWMDSIPLGLGGMQFVDLRGDAYTTGIEHIVASLANTPAIEQADTESEVWQATEIDKVERNPYKGLQAFTVEDTRYFFGRNNLVDELVSVIDGAGHFLPVVGASGSGKSSLVMAGLLPRLEREHPNWTFLKPIVPGIHPLESLAKALSSAIPGSLGTAVLRELRQDTTNRTLHIIADQIDTHQVLLFVDQFEELFILSDSTERDRFIDLLITATEPNSPLIVVLTMRADFMDRPLADGELARLFQEHAVLIKPMDVSDLRDVIVRPAMLQGLTFDENLVGDLLFEVRGEHGALPMLQFTLEQLYERREDDRLTRAAYNKIGGVRGAIARQAEATYSALPSEHHKQLARTLFLRLIEPGTTEQDTTRRRVDNNELILADMDDTVMFTEVTTAFTVSRLLVRDADTLEIAHEALIREWARLGKWLHEARNDMLLRDNLLQVTKDWLLRGKPEDYDGYYRGDLLIEQEALTDRFVLNANEHEFLTNSRNFEDQRQMEKKLKEQKLRFQQRINSILINFGQALLTAIISGSAFAYWIWSVFRVQNLFSSARIVNALALGVLTGLCFGLMTSIGYVFLRQDSSALQRILSRFSTLLLVLAFSVFAYYLYVWGVLQNAEETPGSILLFLGIMTALGYLVPRLLNLRSIPSISVTACFVWTALFIQFSNYFGNYYASPNVAVNIQHMLTTYFGVDDTWWVMVSDSFENIYTVGIPVAILLAMGLHSRQVIEDIISLYLRFRNISDN